MPLSASQTYLLYFYTIKCSKTHKLNRNRIHNNLKINYKHVLKFVATDIIKYILKLTLIRIFHKCLY